MSRRLTKRALVAMAEEQGCVICRRDSGHVDIAPRGLVRPVIRFWENGAITDQRVECTAQKNMTIDAAFRALRLKES